MKFFLFIIILLFWWWAFDVRAQVSGGLSSMPQQWQLTLDTIKSKSQTLITENDGLQVEYRKLIEETQKLQQSIDDQQSKNEQMENFLKERHGRTDQQARIEELTQRIKTKSRGAAALDEQLKSLQREQLNLERKTQAQQDDQLPQLRKQLEDESAQEVLLENELKGLKIMVQMDARNNRMRDKIKVLHQDIEK